jgi:hypothetical protein
MYKKTDQIFIQTNFNGYIRALGMSGPIPNAYGVPAAIAYQMVVDGIETYEFDTVSKKTKKLTLNNVYDDKKFAESANATIAAATQTAPAAIDLGKTVTTTVSTGVTVSTPTVVKTDSTSSSSSTDSKYTTTSQPTVSSAATTVTKTTVNDNTTKGSNNSSSSK